MPRKYHTSPESLGLHRLGHAELANNGQTCGTCEWAYGGDMHVFCGHPTWGTVEPETKRTHQACALYRARSTDDHAAQLYRPETK